MSCTLRNHPLCRKFEVLRLVRQQMQGHYLFGPRPHRQRDDESRSRLGVDCHLRFLAKPQNALEQPFGHRGLLNAD